MIAHKRVTITRSTSSGRRWRRAAKFLRKVWLSALLTTLVLGQAVAAEGDVRRSASELARMNFLRALAIMGDTVEACFGKAKDIDIPHWEKLGVSRDALLRGISYFNRKRHNECVAPAAKDLLMATKMLEMSDRYGWEKAPSTAFVDMVLDWWWDELEAEARYRADASPADREKIERISGLQQPFNMIRSWEAIED